MVVTKLEPMDWARVVAALPVVTSLLGQGSYALKSGSSRFCGTTRKVQSVVRNDMVAGIAVHYRVYDMVAGTAVQCDMQHFGGLY